MMKNPIFDLEIEGRVDLYMDKYGMLQNSFMEEVVQKSTVNDCCDFL